MANIIPVRAVEVRELRTLAKKTDRNIEKAQRRLLAEALMHEHELRRKEYRKHKQEMHSVLTWTCAGILAIVAVLLATISAPWTVALPLLLAVLISRWLR